MKLFQDEQGTSKVHSLHFYFHIWLASINLLESNFSVAELVVLIARSLIVITNTFNTQCQSIAHLNSEMFQYLIAGYSGNKYAIQAKKGM